MQEITNVIFASLLKKYKKISINGIGTFSILIKQASNKKGRKFISPASEINFSKVLSNDFLLENILKKENIFSEENIPEIVSNYVSKIKNEIEKNGQYEFEGIGNLYLDKNKSYTLKDITNSFFYGMPNFSVSIESKKQKNIKPEKVTTKKKIKIPLYVWIIILFLLAGVSSYILFPNEIKNAYNKVIASFNKNKKSTQTTEPKADTTIKQTPLQENIVEDTTKEIIKDTTAISADTLPTQINKKENKEFFVIAGSYTNSADANEACKRLIKKGYPNAVVLTPTLENRFRVAYDGFPDKESALDFLNKTKIKENQSDIWLLKQKNN